MQLYKNNTYELVVLYNLHTSYANINYYSRSRMLEKTLLSRYIKKVDNSQYFHLKENKFTLDQICIYSIVSCWCNILASRS